MFEQDQVIIGKTIMTKFHDNPDKKNDFQIVQSLTHDGAIFNKEKVNKEKKICTSLT